MLKSRNGNIRPWEKFVLVSCSTTTTSTTKGQTTTIPASSSDVDNNNEPPPFTVLNHKLLPLPFVASTSLSPPPPPTFRCVLHPSLPILCDRCRAAFPLATARNTSPTIIASSAYLPVRSLIPAHRCLIPCSALSLKTCRSLLNMKECRSDFTSVRKLAIFSW